MLGKVRCAVVGGNRWGVGQKRLYSQEQVKPTKKLLLMDANGVIYKRVNKKLLQLTTWLIEEKKYSKENIPHARDEEDLATSSAKDQLKQLKKAANRGEITSREYYTHLLNHFGVREEHHGEALEQIKLSEEGIKLFDGIIPALAELRQQSIKLGIITDSMSSTDQKIGWIQNQGLDTTWFDVLVNSCEVGITKPHRKMYEYAMVASKVTPEHTAFIGHKKAELDGAKALGITTITFNPDTDLKQHLSDYDYNAQSWSEIPKLPCFHRP